MKAAKFGLPLLLLSSLMVSYSYNAHAATSLCHDPIIISEISGYDPSINVQKLTIKAGSQSKCIRMLPDNRNAVHYFLRKQLGLRNQLESDLRAKLDTQMKSAVNSTLKHRYTEFKLRGDLSTKLTANNNGEILALVNGFGFNAKAKYTIRNVPSMIAKAYAKVEAKSIAVRAKYDFMTGSAYDLEVDPIDLKVDVDSRIFGISIPVLSNLFNNLVEDIIRDKIQDYLNSKTDGWSKSLFSLDKVIPDEKFGSLGIAVKKRLTNLLPGKYIRLSASVQYEEDASFYVDLSGDFSILMKNKELQNPCYIYSDSPCNKRPY